eukprot:scaffold24675_cov80-Skeletonema_marinoi.AAC.1
MNGPGRGLLATKQQQQQGVDSKKKWMEARTAGYKGINGNSLMRVVLEERMWRREQGKISRGDKI